MTVKSLYEYHWSYNFKFLTNASSSYGTNSYNNKLYVIKYIALNTFLSVSYFGGYKLNFNFIYDYILWYMFYPPWYSVYIAINKRIFFLKPD